MSETYDLTIIDPESVRLFFHGGILRLTLPDRSYRAARVYRAFPLSDPDRYYGLTDGAGKEIGIIQDPSRMDTASRDAAATDLEQRYFVPTVERVLDVRDDYGATIFEVGTNRGERRYVVRSLRDNVVELSGRRLLVTDVDGNRFEIADIEKLDPRARSVFLRSL